MTTGAGTEMGLVWGRAEKTEEAIERAAKVSQRADDTFALLARTVVRLHRTTRELEEALEELRSDDTE